MKNEWMHIVFSPLIIWLCNCLVFWILSEYDLFPPLLLATGLLAFVLVFAIYRVYAFRKSLKSYCLVAGLVGILSLQNFFFTIPVLGQMPLRFVPAIAIARLLHVFISAGLGLCVAWILRQLIGKFFPSFRDEPEQSQAGYLSDEVAVNSMRTTQRDKGVIIQVVGILTLFLGLNGFFVFQCSVFYFYTIVVGLIVFVTCIFFGGSLVRKSKQQN